MENFKNDILEASTTGTKDDEDTKETKSKNLTTYQQNRTRIFSQVTVLIKMLTFVSKSVSTAFTNSCCQYWFIFLRSGAGVPGCVSPTTQTRGISYLACIQLEYY